MRLIEMQKCPICGMMRCDDHKKDKKDQVCGICHHAPCVCDDEQQEETYKGKKVMVGKHKDDSDSRFDADELSMGIEHEKEHTEEDESLAKRIAKDHLIQFPKYYSSLRKNQHNDGGPITLTKWLDKDGKHTNSK